MADSNIGFRDWAIAIYLVTTSLKGVSSMKLHRDLGVTQKTAWFMLHRIREAWADQQAEPFDGPVEADETYVGGKAKNMHAKRRCEHIRGRGPAGKIAVVGVKDRASNRVAARPVPDTTAETLLGVVTGVAESGGGSVHRRAPILQATGLAGIRPRRGVALDPRVRARRHAH